MNIRRKKGVFHKLSDSRRRAFTLIEIMVASVIMIVLSGLVIQITSEVLKVWNLSSGKLAANAEARIAMDLLTQDLETAVFRNNEQQWLRIESPTNVGSPVAGETVVLHLFSPAMDRPETKPDGTVANGDICAIAYRLAYGPSYAGSNAPKTFALYRAIADSGTTFNTLMGPGTSDPQLVLTDGFWDSANVADPDNFLAGNIVDFKVFVYGADSAGNEVVINDPDANGTIDNNYIFGGTGDTGEDATYVEITLTIVSDEGLELLELPSLAGTGYSSITDIVREHGEVFTRRVNFLARPL